MSYRVSEISSYTIFVNYGKTCPKRLISKRPKISFQDKLSLNACQKYCRMHQGEQEEHSTILLTFVKLPFVINIFVLSIFEWPFCVLVPILMLPIKCDIS